MIGPRLRLFWQIYLPTAFTLLCGVPTAIAIGPLVEERLSPIRVSQRMEHVVRTADRLCWDWVSTKTKVAVSDNIDVFVDVGTEHGAAAAIFERDTGMPWTQSRAVAPGPQRQAYCTILPPYVHADTPVRVRQVAWYPGAWGPWHVRVVMPDVVDPAGSVIP